MGPGSPGLDRRLQGCHHDLKPREYKSAGGRPRVDGVTETAINQRQRSPANSPPAGSGGPPSTLLNKWKEVTPEWPGCGLPPAPQPPVDPSSWVPLELWAPLPDSVASDALLWGWHLGPGPWREPPLTAGDEGAFAGSKSVMLGKHGRALNKGQECFVPSALCPLLTECPWHVRAPVCC